MAVFLSTSVLAQTTSWTGVTSSSWFDASNWSNGVPTSSRLTIVSVGAQSNPPVEEILILQPTNGDTARTGALTIQNKGRVRLESEPAPGALIVHGKTQILNGGGFLLRSGRVEFRDDVRVSNGGVLNCGSGTLVFTGRRIDVDAGGLVVVDGSMTETMGQSSTTINGNFQLARLKVRNRDTLFVTGNLHIVELLEIEAGRVVFVKTTGLLTVDGPVIGGGTIVEEAALPVQLTSFAATSGPQGVTLRWSTATEVDNAGWEVERRAVGGPMSNTNATWTRIAFVAGAGTSTSLREYVFVDPLSDPDAAVASSRFAYRLKQIDRDGAVSHSWESEVERSFPQAMTLEPNFPNPFNPSTTFRFSAPIAGEVRLEIVDLLGRTVAEAYRGHVVAGASVQVTWDAAGMPSGAYVARLTLGDRSATRRIVLAR
jgi:hypothetical protein